MKIKAEDKIKLKDKLEAFLGRPASVAEKANAEKDPALVMEILLDKIEDLEKRVEDLEDQ